MNNTNLYKNTQRILSRMTFSHFLCAIIPGLVYTLCIPTAISDIINCMIDNDVFPDLPKIRTVAGYFVLMIIAYLLGLINIVACDILWSGVTKNYDMISYCKDKVGEQRYR